MAGAARIDLEGNQVGTVTASDEEDAKRKIAKAVRSRHKPVLSVLRTAGGADMSSSPIHAH